MKRIARSDYDLNSRLHNVNKKQLEIYVCRFDNLFLDRYNVREVVNFFTCI